MGVGRFFLIARWEDSTGRKRSIRRYGGSVNLSGCPGAGLPLSLLRLPIWQRRVRHPQPNRHHHHAAGHVVPEPGHIGKVSGREDLSWDAASVSTQAPWWRTA